jgi:hypothetical protein
MADAKEISVRRFVFEHYAVALKAPIEQIHLLKHFDIDFAKLKFFADGRRSCFNGRGLFLCKRGWGDGSQRDARAKRDDNQGPNF